MPKESDISTRRVQLSSVKRALLEKRMQGTFKNLTRVQTISQRPPQTPAYLSFAQQSLWFLYQLQPDSPAYNIHKAFGLKGLLNVMALERSLNEIVRRHEVLRTTFAEGIDHSSHVPTLVTVNAQPTQVIAPTLTLRMSVVDLRQFSDVDREAQIQKLAVEEARRPFDLAKGPLIRASLLELGTEDHVLLLSMHHIISDEWSFGVFWRELGTLYKTFSTGSLSLLPELSIQYADFAHWQRGRLQSEVIETQLAYWKTRLGGRLPALQLPTDRPRPAIQTFRGALQSLILSPFLPKALKTLSDQERATMFMTLLAAFNTLLHRYTGQTDIIVGTPIANRTGPETEGLIGYFLNTLALRIDLTGNPTFRELLRRVRDGAFEAYAHKDLPFEKLVEELQPERNLSHNPLFQVMFVLQQDAAEELELLGLTPNQMEVDSGVAKFDLTLFMTETEQGLHAMFEYNTDLFDSDTIKRMLGHLQTLLAGIVANPYQHLSALPLLTEAERHQMLIDWNRTESEFPQNQCWHQLFQAQVERTPKATAVVYEDTRLSYRELDRRANHLAHYLRGLGVGPDVLVGIYVERSLEMVIGLLGILKAGGAYVPLDAVYPKERLAFMLVDAQVSVLLTQKRLMTALPHHEAKLVSLDADWQAISGQREDSPVSGVTPENLAYVIYTSGSTGQPKGVMVTHRNLMHSTMARIKFYDRPIQSFLLLSSFAFDSSVAGIFWTLCQGGTLCIPQEDLYIDMSYLAGLIHRNGVSHLLCIPSIYLQLLATEPRLLSSLTTVIVAGEACPVQLVKAHTWSQLEATLFNEYGPSEATVWCTVFDCSISVAATTVPIGRPIPNTTVYVLDAALQPLPIGVAGELYIGGAGVTRGYLNRSELTKERFIPDPFRGCLKRLDT